MNRCIISTVAVVVVMAVAWIAFGQEQSDRAQRYAQYRQAQLKAIEVIQAQAGKLKADMEETSRRDFSNWQNLSEEERAKLREEWIKRRQERQKILETIGQQIIRLKGPRQLRTEHEESIAELQAVHSLAVSEKAEKTAKRLEEIIAKRNKDHEDAMKKLGLERFGRSR